MKIHIPQARWVLLLTLASMFALGLSDNIRGPLFPELLSFFQLSNAQGSWSFAVASAAAMLGNILSAWVIKKIELNKLLGLSMAIMAAGLLWMGLSPDFTNYVFGAFIYGLSMGATAVAQNLMIAENIPGEKQTKFFASLHSLYGFSSLTAPFVASRAPGWFTEVSSAQSYLTGWQSAFFISGLFSALVMLLILSTQPSPALQSAHRDDQLSAERPAHWTVMIWFAGFFAFYVAAEILVSTRLALYMRTYFGMSLEQSSNYVTYFFIFLLAGRLVLAFKSFSMPIKKQLNLSLVSSLVSLLLGLLVHPFFLALTGLTMAPYYPLAVTYIAQVTGRQNRRFLTFALSVQSLSVILMHVGVGYLTDRWGLMQAYGFGGLLLVAALLCLNFHPKISYAKSEVKV
jgi:FHS family glucose/mannose:H+ symporter-like MFS transporter